MPEPRPSERPRAPSRVLCVIPARGGSRRLPGKNLLPVAGKALLTHTIEHALAAGSVDRVVVSTDDPAIAEVARGAGAEVVERPEELSGDTAPSEAALLHALDALEAADGYRPDLVVFLQCTAPVRAPNDIDAAVARLRREGADSLLSVVPSRSFLWRLEGDRPVPINYDPADRPRSQDRPAEFAENGSIYVTRAEVLRATGNRLGGRVTLHPMAEESFVDVDGPLDLVLADAILRGRRDEP